MKNILIIIFLISFSFNYGQSERSLEDTKSYIVKIINENGLEENSTKRRLRAEFEGDLLRINSMNKDFSESLNNGIVYNFANVYKYRGPKKKPGDIAHITIWIDYLVNEKNDRWEKTDLEFDVYGYETAEQLIVAFSHLNKLLIEKKPKVEKF